MAITTSLFQVLVVSYSSRYQTRLPWSGLTMSTTEQTSKPILKLWLPGRVGMLTLMMFIIALLINFLLFEIGLAIPFFYGVVLAAIDWYRMRRPFKATLHLVFGFVLTIA